MSNFESSYNKLAEYKWKTTGYFIHPAVMEWLIEVLSYQQTLWLDKFDIDIENDEKHLVSELIKGISCLIAWCKKKFDFQLIDIIENGKPIPVMLRFEREENNQIKLHLVINEIVEKNINARKIYIRERRWWYTLDLWNVKKLRNDSGDIYRFCVLLVRYLIEKVSVDIARYNGGNRWFGDLIHSIKLSKDLEKFDGLKWLDNIIKVFENEIKFLNN